MQRSRPRPGAWFALTLLLPTAFAAVWLWLVPGGVVARARAAERSAAAERLERAAERYRSGLVVAGAVEGFVLDLDAEGRVIGPFAREVAAPPPSTAGVAERTAIAHSAAGQVAEAMPFFAHAAGRDELTPEGWLAYAQARSADDVNGARALLDDARERFGDARCGAMPFALVALLVEARWPIPDRDVEPVRDAFCRLVVQVEPAVALAALADLAASPVGLDERRADALRGAAAAVQAFGGEPLPTRAGAVCADGTRVVCGAYGAMAYAVAPGRADRLRSDELSLAHTLEPDFEFVVGPGDGGLPELTLAEFGETWSARPAAGALPASALLSTLAVASVVLALVTFVLGNLLLWRMTRRESQLVRLRADFVDVVSHELRTPLTALSLKAEMLASGDVPEARRAHYLAGLHQDVQRLTDQVERILDFGRLQKGAELRRDVVPGRSLLAKGLREGRPALRLVDQQVEVDAPRALPAIVGDMDVLGRALRNLLENAAKYAPAGSTVAVRAFANGDELVVEVADRGPGVPSADRRSIFQPFVRGSDASPGVPGSGLGLALVAAAAESHGGRVDVAERPGGGAVFTLHLPVGRGEETA